MEKYKTCFNCKKEISGEPILAEPNRHAMSPLSVNYGKQKSGHHYDSYCSETCHKETDAARYVFFASLDKNASDSECFEGESAYKDRLGRTIRVGKCKITGERVEVEPLQPGNKSGQPQACYEHFELRKSYMPTYEKLSWKV